MLSCGHTSLTLYIQLFLSGYGLTVEDLRRLRQWESLTPGHPEHGHTPGVEITTGPLGQGVANAVGMAMAARRERGLLDPDAAPGQSPFDHTIWCVASDGDIEEGVSGEASSLAGHQKLGNLVVLYDDNHISIEDDTDIAFSEDVGGPLRGLRLARPAGRRRRGRARAGRRPARGAGGDRRARRSSSVRTIIGCPGAEPAEHRQGARRGARRRRGAATKEVLGFDPDAALRGPGRRARARPRGRRPRPPGARRVAAALRRLGAGPPAGPALLDRMRTRTLPGRLGPSALPTFEADAKGLATRRPPRQGAERARPTCCPSCGAARPTWPSQQQHHHGGRAVASCPVGRPAKERGPVRPDAALRHPRARDGRRS